MAKFLEIPRRVAEANAGTREQGRELALAYMWRIHMETGLRRGRRSDRRYSANSLWERDDSCKSVGASIVVAGVGAGGVLRGSLDVSEWAKLDMFESHEQAWVSLHSLHPWLLSQWDLCHV